MGIEDDLLKTGLQAVEIAHSTVRDMPMAERRQRVEGGKADTTKVDMAAEKAVFDCLTKAAEEHDLAFRVLSEEQGGEIKTLGKSEKVVYVVLDPVDGTSNATTNVPIYGANIAFTRPQYLKEGEHRDVTLGEFTVGVSAVEGRGRFYAIKGGKAYMLSEENDPLELFMLEEEDADYSRILLDPYNAEDREACEVIFMSLRAGSKAFRTCDSFHCSGFEIMLLLAEKGHVPAHAAYVAAEQKVDNILAGKIIVEAAGGEITDWEGNSLDNYKIDARPSVLFANTEQIADHIRPILNER